MTDDKKEFGTGLIIAIYSHLSDLQEMGVDRERINLIKRLISELELVNSRQEISQDRLDELVELCIK